jgi:hypothetical protein
VKAFFLSLIITFSAIVASLSIKAQTKDELREEYRKERRAMMREMMKMLKQEQKDIMKEFDQDMNPFDNLKRLQGQSKRAIRVTQSREIDGSISIMIHMDKKNSNVDISTKDNIISIKSVSEKTGSTTFNQSSFSQRITIPPNYMAKPPVQFDGGIKISLVRKK